MTTTGSFIWYELITRDADAAAKFYGAVVGWKIGARAEPLAGGMDYRMIGRSDGGFAGGVMTLTPDMLQHGARPCWLGYLHVADVDAAVSAIVADGGTTLMPRKDLPVGSIAMVADPMGTPFYVMAPIPPPDKPAARSDVFDVEGRSACALERAGQPRPCPRQDLLRQAFRFPVPGIDAHGPAGRLLLHRP